MPSLCPGAIFYKKFYGRLKKKSHSRIETLLLFNLLSVFLLNTDTRKAVCYRRAQETGSRW